MIATRQLKSLSVILEMLRIDRAVDTGDLPSTRSQIINVINAEKERIDQLERQLSKNMKHLRSAFWLVAWLCWYWLGEMT